MSEEQNTETMPAEMVLDYLHEHPAVLTKLTIPHQHDGSAVSLIERQVISLREQNQKTRDRLHDLINIARQNESLAKRMHQLVLALLATEKPQKIFNKMYDHLKNNFHADCISLRLFADPISADDVMLDEFLGTEIPERALFKEIIDKRFPESGEMCSEQRSFLFG